MTTRRAFVLALTVGALAAAVAAPAGMSTHNVAFPTLQVKSSRFGKLLFDGRGFVLYAFTRDTVGGKSTCYGDCAAAWPPYLLKGKRAVAPGLRKTLLGTTKRLDGKLQVTYAGRPLYYYRGDTKSGYILCQECSSTAGGGSWSRAPASSSADIRRRGSYRAAAVGSLYVTANGPTLPQAELLRLAGRWPHV